MSILVLSIYRITTIYTVYGVVLTFLQGDKGFSAQEKRATTTLNKNEITDTEGYSDLPVHSVSIYLET